MDKVLDKKNKIYPKKKKIFKIFKYLSPSDIKVVILGQDPYINFEVVDNKEVPQAEGLSFSVPKRHRKIPPSLKNIFKEIKNSYPDFKYENGNLKKWIKIFDFSLLVEHSSINKKRKDLPTKLCTNCYSR